MPKGCLEYPLRAAHSVPFKYTDIFISVKTETSHIIDFGSDSEMEVIQHNPSEPGPSATNGKHFSMLF